MALSDSFGIDAYAAPRRQHLRATPSPRPLRAETGQALRPIRIDRRKPAIVSATAAAALRTRTVAVYRP